MSWPRPRPAESEGGGYCSTLPCGADSLGHVRLGPRLISSNLSARSSTTTARTLKPTVAKLTAVAR